MQIKICGITNVEDALAAAEYGADYIGLNFYPSSPRFIDLERAAAILSKLPLSVKPVALFVEAARAVVGETLHALPRISHIQWHGKEMPADIDGIEWIRAFSVRDESSLEIIRRSLAVSDQNGTRLHGILVDAHVPGLHGGTGQTAPWELLASFNRSIPLFLAGGLTPENVAEAIRQVRPDGVDVASGVESTPGRKDLQKMKQFIENARGERS